MRFGVSGCPTRGETVRAQHQTDASFLTGRPVMIPSASALVDGGIMEPAAGPAESCQFSSRAETHQRIGDAALVTWRGEEASHWPRRASQIF